MHIYMHAHANARAQLPTDAHTPEKTMRYHFETNLAFACAPLACTTLENTGDLEKDEKLG